LLGFSRFFLLIKESLLAGSLLWAAVKSSFKGFGCFVYGGHGCLCLFTVLSRFLAILSLFSKRPILPCPLFTLFTIPPSPSVITAALSAILVSLLITLSISSGFTADQLFFLLSTVSVLLPGPITTSLSPIKPSLPMLILASFLINFLTSLFQCKRNFNCGVGYNIYPFNYAHINAGKTHVVAHLQAVYIIKYPATLKVELKQAFLVSDQKYAQEQDD
jgi:hypothetical protein